jgi:hypothetical protein
MRDRYPIAAAKAAIIAVPLWLILALAAGTFTWRLVIVGVVIFAVLFVITVSRAPRRYDSPPSPDEWWRNNW